MTTKDIQKRIEEIRQEHGCSGAAHEMQDALHRDVLRAIVVLGGPGAELAKLALTTEEINIPRWYE